MGSSSADFATLQGEASAEQAMKRLGSCMPVVVSCFQCPWRTRWRSFVGSQKRGESVHSSSILMSLFLHTAINLERNDA